MEMRDGSLAINSPLPRQSKKVQGMIVARLKPSTKLALRITEWRFLGTSTFQRLRMLTLILDLFCFDQVVIDDPKFRIGGPDQTEQLWISAAWLFEVEQAHRSANLRQALRRVRDGGVTLGRPRKLDEDRLKTIRTLHQEGLSQSAIGRRLGLSRASVWRAIHNRD
jgi:predicted DNA-binding protein (UPF0251 family)